MGVTMGQNRRKHQHFSYFQKMWASLPEVASPPPPHVGRGWGEHSVRAGVTVVARKRAPPRALSKGRDALLSVRSGKWLVRQRLAATLFLTPL